jgi:predicted RNase H-like HicB family nuclease
MRQFYVAILAQHAGKHWATVPDLPGVTSVGTTAQEALEVAIELANEYVAKLASEGARAPGARPFDLIDLQDGEVARALIPVTLFEADGPNDE